MNIFKVWINDRIAQIFYFSGLIDEMRIIFVNL